MAASGGEGDTPGAASLDLADLSLDVGGSMSEDGKVDLVEVMAEGAEAVNGPVQNGYLNEEAEKPTLNREVVAETIEEAAAVIVECAMNGAMHVAMSQPPGAGAGGGTRRRAAAYASPDSAVNFTNGVGRDVVEMDPSEVNGSTTTETSALSEVMEQAAAAADRSAEELAQDNEQLVDVTSAAFAQREEAQGAAGDAREVADAQDTPELDEEIVVPSIQTTQDDDDEFTFDSPKKEAVQGDEGPSIPSIKIDHDEEEEFNFPGGMAGMIKPPAIQVIAASPSVEDREFLVDAGGESSTDDQDAWAGVKEITPTFAEDGTTPVAKVEVATPLISYHEAFEHISNSDLDQFLGQITTTVQRRGFNKIKHLIFGPPKLHRDLHAQRDAVFCMASAQLKNDDPVHVRILQTLHRKLTGSKFDCNRFGSHWEQIGFQGNDPATDLRGGGMLGLLQLLYMVSDPRFIPLTRDIYKLSRHDEQNFPFSLMGINMSRICIQALREDCLNKECNRRRSVIEAMNEFFMGCYHHLYTIWKYQGKTIQDSGFVIKDVETYSKKNPVALQRALEASLQRRKVGAASPAKTDAFKGIADMDSDDDN